MTKHRRSRDVPHNAGGGLPSSRHRKEREARRDREFRADRGATLIPGTNGSWPASDCPPMPPPLLMFHDNDHYPEPVKVFGQYPKGFLGRMETWFGCARSEVLHVCSGSLPRGEGIRVDVRPEARPDILADGRALPFRDGSIACVMIDPPYTKQYARDLYGLKYPTPKSLLAEAARVVRPCGRILFVHFIVPNPPPGCDLLTVRTFTTGCGFQVRGVSIFVREQDGLDLDGPTPEEPKG